MRNHIQLAASSDSRFHAVLLIRSSLQIDEASDVADRVLPDAAEWKGLHYTQRIEAIRQWLDAECADCLERAEVFSMAAE